ncbi:hypothetical protein II582_00910 [bacterium]|nr:hypothetical protein [bacterium]
MNDIIVQTLPNTADFTSHFHHSDLFKPCPASNCAIYWWAIIKQSLYFLASDKMSANVHDTKFWNSSTYR